LLFIILVAAVWLARGNQGPAGPAVVPRALLLLLLAAQAWTGIREAVTDRVRAYSAARETARVLVKEGLGQAPLFGLRDAAVASVLAYLGAPAAFYGPAMREGSFVIWDQARRDPVNIAAVVDRAEATPGAVVLDCGDVIVDGPPPDPRLVEWRRVVGAVESCIVYRLARRGSDGG
jgi:hypothetical protein